MACHKCFLICLMSNVVTLGWSWDVFTNAGLRRAADKPYIFKNEYVFGDCKNANNIQALLAHEHLTWATYRDVTVKRASLSLKRIPRCIILRSSTYDSNTYRSTRYNFEVCVSRACFCYHESRFLYYWYEWYVPEDIIPNLDWDIYFYGPSGSDWKYA